MADINGALQFLNQGTAPSASSHYSQSSTQLPPAIQSYVDQMLQKAAQHANEPLPLYGGPRIAGQDAMTKSADTQVAGMAGIPGQTTQAAQALISQGANNNNPLSTAQPYLAAGTDPTYNNVDKYINPYNRNVTDQIAAAGARNFNENIMPGMNSRAIAGGNITGNSTQSLNMQDNAARDEQIAVSNAQAGALQQGYQGSLAAAQQGNQNQLQAGNMAGQLNNEQVNNSLNAGALTNQVGTAGVNNGLAVAGANNSLGEQNRNFNQGNMSLAYDDFMKQYMHPITGLNEMGGALGQVANLLPHGQVNYDYTNGINGANDSTKGDQVSPINQMFGEYQNINGNNTPVKP